MEFNKKECGDYYDLKYRDGDIVEIRAIDVKGNGFPIEEYAEKKEDFLEICERLNNDDNYQVYAGHNPRLYKGKNKDAVKLIRFICLDCDPVRKRV